MRQQYRNVLFGWTGSFFLFSCTVQKKVCKHLTLFFLIIITSNNNTARMKIVIKCFWFAKEFWAEYDILNSVFFTHWFSISDRYCWLDDHENIWIYFKGPFYCIFNGRGIKEMINVIIICRCGYDNQFRIFVGGFLVGCCMKIQFSLSFSGFLKKSFYLIILDWTDELI